MTSVLSHISNLTRDAFFINIANVGSANYFKIDGTPETLHSSLMGSNSAGSVLLRDMGRTVRTPAQSPLAPTLTNQVILRKVVVVTSAPNSAASGTSSNPGEGDAVSSPPFYINLMQGVWARV